MEIHVHIHDGSVKEGQTPKPRSQKKVSKSASPPNKKPRKKSAWQKYMGQKKNQVKFKSGAKKGRLDLSKMSRAYKRSRQ